MVDRLIWRELFGPFVNSVFMFVMLLFTSAYLQKLMDLVARGATTSIVAKVGLYSLPVIITQTLPMGMLLGTILAMGRLSGDSENIALHACGISFYRMARPVGIMGFLIGVVAMAWNETIVPPATTEMYKLQAEVVEAVANTSTAISYNVKRKGTDLVDEWVYIAGGYDKKSQSLLAVTILKFSDSDPKKPEVLIRAERAKAASADPGEFNWDLYDVTVKYLDPTGQSRYVQETHIDHTRPKDLPRGTGFKRDFKGIVQNEVQDNRQMTFRQLRDKINRERNEVSQEIVRADEFDLWSKIALPLATFIFGIVAAPLGIRPQRGSKAMGFGVAIICIFLYWFAHNSMYTVAKGGAVSPMTAAFTADFIGIIASIILMSRTRQ